jgi:hypothetical protein
VAAGLHGALRFKKKSTSPLKKLARRKFRGFPVATLAFYGPDDQFASKVAVGIIAEEGAPPMMLRLWSEGPDVRFDPSIAKQIADHLASHGVKSVSSVEQIIGCPHEEGIDYPDGEVCPQCPYWAHRNRFTGELLE